MCDWRSCDRLVAACSATGFWVGKSGRKVAASHAGTLQHSTSLGRRRGRGVGAVGVDVRFCSRGTPECGECSRGQVVGVRWLASRRYTPMLSVAVYRIYKPHTLCPPLLYAKRRGNRKREPCSCGTPQHKTGVLDKVQLSTGIKKPSLSLRNGVWKFGCDA